ncbi:hypothetical protein TruAng_003901 [Truncatella angustata]|nr:hypothetical protein TruAng_003901 [Truncatella angustata]
MLEPSEGGLDGAPVPGLFRVLRNEFFQITLALLDLSPTFDARIPGSADLGIDAWITSIDISVVSKDLELAEVQGDILLPRFISSSSMDTEIALTAGRARPTLKELSSSGHLPLVAGQKNVQNTAWKTDEKAYGALDPDRVEVQVADVSLTLSGSPVSELDVSHVTGHITRCGSEVTEFLEGDRVVALNGLHFKPHVRQHRSMVLRIPQSAPICWYSCHCMVFCPSESRTEHRYWSLNRSAYSHPR